MLKRIALWLTLSLIFPIALHAQPADSLRLLWRNDAISGVTAHAFSHSGNVLALANDKEIKLWDLTKGKIVRTVTLPIYNYTRNYSYYQMAFTSNDGEIVMLTNVWTTPFGWCPVGERPRAGNELRVNVNTGAVLEVKSIVVYDGKWALSQDARCIAYLSDGGELSLHDAASFQTIVHDTLSGAKYRGSQNGIWFGAGGKSIVVEYQGHLSFRDPQTLAIRSTPGRSYSYIQAVIADGVFPGMEDTVMLDASTGHPSELQPWNLPKSIRDVGGWPSPRTAVLFDNGNFIAAEYTVRCYPPHSDCGNGVTVTDSLVISSRAHPEGEWGMIMNSEMQILDILPDKETLLLGDGRTFITINASTHKIKRLADYLESVVGFMSDGRFVTRGVEGIAALDPNDGKILWSKESVPPDNILLSPNGDLMAQVTARGVVRYYDREGTERDIYSNLGTNSQLISYLDNALLIRDQNEVSSLYTVPDVLPAKSEQHLRGYWNYVPAGNNAVLSYRGGDSAVIYDYENDRVVAAFGGGLNIGISQVVMSHDRKWVVTVDYYREAKLWRASDGQLMMHFRLDGNDETISVAFSPNDRYLIYSTQSEFMSRDIITGETKKFLSIGAWVNLYFNRDGSKLVLWSRNDGLSMYATPSSWLTRDTIFDPKTVYLPLRFYTPADASDALDSTGAKYNPPRTHAELELRYADGKLLEKILDGPYPKGKWHLWEYEMTKYPKGTYIMHTEIGGVVKDETREVR